MKYYRAIFKIHKWFGLVLAIFLIVMAVTSFILLEPWITGMDKSNPVQDTNPYIEGNKSPAAQEANSKELNLSRAHNQNNAYGMDQLD